MPDILWLEVFGPMAAPGMLLAAPPGVSPAHHGCVPPSREPRGSAMALAMTGTLVTSLAAHAARTKRPVTLRASTTRRGRGQGGTQMRPGGCEVQADSRWYIPSIVAY